MSIHGQIALKCLLIARDCSAYAYDSSCEDDE